MLQWKPVQYCSNVAEGVAREGGIQINVLLYPQRTLLYLTLKGLCPWQNDNLIPPPYNPTSLNRPRP